MSAQTEKLLFVDTETGGIDPTKHSLLSLALVVWQDFKIIDTKEILINDGVLSVTEKALEINKIDLKHHKEVALSPNESIKEIDFFISKHFRSEEKITLAGHNVNFDVNFLRFFLNQRDYSFSDKFSHRFVDTSSILYYLYLANKIDQKAVSSQDAFDLFGIDTEGRHTAIGDAIATAKLFSSLLYLIKKVKLPKIKDVTQINLFDVE